ncbi:FYVE, RhoGEF and PH domain-containing protein 4-like isoform X2 [Hydractinia symbiolongicarpus]|uniref:FYVE, RhoGEF and PH domain-containing protein 4-like isoform X2 n=1 Tax=Hydractinia symbiolongicarpus TaxID=13093 RepID=UPI00254E2337|nr:FYVE, RhoGEF and PH domain-containing protein 4-like isoform X2 [Hydractinia symbiolongicarpus]
MTRLSIKKENVGFHGILHQAIMQNLHQRKIKQKIAKRMVTFAALNYSRPRDDTGKPLLQTRARFYSHHVNSQPTTEVQRTLSDPDLYRDSLKRNKKSSDDLLGENYEIGDPTEETFTPYTAVGSHEDIHELKDKEKQQSVQILLSNFERRSACDVDYKIDDKINNAEDKTMLSSKPVPKPRPKNTNGSPIPKPRVPSKPKLKPKPLDLVENEKHKFSVSLPSEVLKSIENNYDRPTSKVMVEEKVPVYEVRSPSKKQGSTKVDVVPYAIVKLQMEPNQKESPPVLPPKDVSSPVSPKFSPLQSPTCHEQYLEPIEAQSPVVSPVSKQAPKSMSEKVKTKRNKYKSKTATISNSYTDEKPSPFSDEAKRRQSLPDYLQDISSVDKNLSQKNHLYETVSPAMSDEEGWDSDEFDDASSGEEEFTVVKVSQAIPKMPHLEGTERKIYNIVTEILTTERAYVRRLYLLDKVFHERFVQEAKENNMIPEKVVNEIFPNLSPIYKFHSTILLPELEARIMEWAKVDKIGDIFKTLGHCLLLYTEFVKNFDKATSTLNHWIKKSPKFAAVVEELQKRPECENLSLQHHMLEPVQRVPRYKLLLQDYLKKLPADSPDRKESEASLVIISKAAIHANNSMKENEKFKKLLDIEDRIQDGLHSESLVTASRVFLKEGELTKLAARSGNRMARTVMLFNDFLLCCSLTATGKLRVRQIMDLAGLSIDEVDSTLPENSFRIKSRQRILDLIAHSEEEKEEWVAAIRAAVIDLHERRGSTIERMLEEDRKKNSTQSVGQTAPLWVKDEDVTMCMLCALKFGLVHRKHHCRGCGRVVCDKCSNYRASLAYSGDEVKRICFACSQKLGITTKDSVDKKDARKSVRARDLSASADMCGEVFWKPPGKGWSKEWVVLTNFVLYIQKKKQDVKARLTLPVPGFEVAPPSSADEIDTAHPHCIKLHKKNKKDFTYFISSDSKEIITQWEEHLQHAVKAQKVPITEHEEE